MSRASHRVLHTILTLTLVASPGLAADFDGAMANFQAGKYVEAAAQFQEFVDQSPAYDYGYFMLGSSFIKMNKPEAAEDSFRKAIELNGDRFEYHHGLAHACYTRKQYDKTIAALRTAEGLATDSRSQYSLYQLRGLAYTELEKWGDAIEDLEKARKIKSSGAILDRLGEAYYALGHHDKAVPVLREALEAVPSNAANLTRLSKGLMDLGAEARDAKQKKTYYTEALSVAQRLQRARPASYESHNLVGRAAFGAKDFATAESAFETVLEKKPDHCYAMVNLGKVHIAQQQWTEAEKVLTRAETCAPRMAVIYESLGFVVQKQKRLEDAVGYYEQALAIKSSESTRQAIEVCKKNIEIKRLNQDMDLQEQAMADAAKKEAERVAEAERKQAEWEKKTRDD